jgi:hypothetical protein
MKHNTEQITGNKTDLHVSQNYADAKVSKFTIYAYDIVSADRIFMAYILVVFCITLVIHLHMNLFYGILSILVPVNFWSK